MASKSQKYAIISIMTLLSLLLVAGSASAFEGCKNSAGASVETGNNTSAGFDINSTVICYNYTNTNSLNISGNLSDIQTSNNAFSVTFVNCNIVLFGNISTNATITLGASNLTVNSSLSNKLMIDLKSGAVFSLLNGSNISANDSDKKSLNAGYNIIINSGATAYINQSYIEDTANGSNAGFSVAGTLWVNNSTIQHSLDYAINASGGTINITQAYFFNNRLGLLINQTPIVLVNSNLTNLGNNLVSWQQNITVNNTSVENVSCLTNRTNITVSWPVKIYVNNSHGNPNNTALPVSSATVLVTSSSQSSFENTTITANINGTTATKWFTEYVQTGTMTYAQKINYSAYTINVTSPHGYWNSTSSVNISKARDTAVDTFSRLNFTVYAYYNNVSVTNHTSYLNGSAGSYANFTFAVTNLGNGGGFTATVTRNWSVVNITSNASSIGWSMNYTRTSANLSNGSALIIRGRVNIPPTARPDTNFTFNVTARIGGRGGTAGEASFILYVRVNNTTGTEGTDYGRSGQNATTYLTTNLSDYGFWGSNSTYSTAWGLWAYNLTFRNKTSGGSSSGINNSTNWINLTGVYETNGYWSDDTGAEGNETTAFMLLALIYNNYSETPSQKNNFLNLTRTVLYLQNQTNSTDNAYLCWPNASTGSCDAYNTSIILSALWRSTSKNLTIVNNATNWLTKNQSNNGSWNNNINHTAWAIYALVSASNSSQNLTNATTWLKNQQNIEGYFGNSNNIVETALAVIALKAAGASEWTVDIDQNSSTTDDQYAGSIKYALDWILKKQEQVGAGGGGWGTSPADAKTTAMALLAAANYGSLAGNVSGYGAAVNLSKGLGRVANVTVTMTGTYGTYSTTSNELGEYVLNVPAGTYALVANHSLFENNTTNTSVVIGSGQNVTQNLGMKPEMQIVGLYANDYFSFGSSVSAGVSYTLQGNCSYLYNTTQAVYANVTVINSAGADSGKFHHTTSATTVNGTFSLSGTSPSAAGVYIVNITCTDFNGSTVGALVNITVSTTGSSDNPVSAGGAGGAGGGTDYSISITSYDSQLSVIQGESLKSSLTLKNSGLKKLEGVRIEVIGIPESWYTYKIGSTGLTTTDLSSSESATFDVTFTPPADAEPKTYTVTLKAKDKAGLALAEKKVTFKVTKVWDTSKISELNTQIEAIKTDLSAVKADVKVLEASGISVTEMKTDLDSLATAIQNAITSYNNGDYTEAERYYKEAQTLLEKIKTAASAAKPPETKVSKLISGISLGKVSIAIIIIVVGALVGFIVWYKLFRVIPMREIKKDTALFSEGARIEGVVKSITETSKGKVFLIQDHTEKLHVRYPFYSTIEVGNVIRAVGVVKTYKEVPYMDAGDVHRVTVKHFPGIAGASNFIRRFRQH